MKKKILHILSFAFLILFLCFIAVPTLGFADVGNQNDYDYSDDYDYDSSSYGNDSSSLSSVFTGLAFLDGGPVFGIIVVLIIVIILPILRRMARRKGPKFSRTATS
ncbi:MAG: hypothetical protein LBU41_05965, partial [Clostridiales Family XIII bacterium]|nr:hypothetical protein [Clostridiales Family XIII bacterium]